VPPSARWRGSPHHDAELLFAAALLHDTGLPTSDRDVDFTRSSARIARDVAEEVGLSSAATETMRTAITLHLSPNVPLARGPVAYLLAAGAGVDVVLKGYPSWDDAPWDIPADLRYHDEDDEYAVLRCRFDMNYARLMGL
jgi:HD domain